MQEIDIIVSNIVDKIPQERKTVSDEQLRKDITDLLLKLLSATTSNERVTYLQMLQMAFGLPIETVSDFAKAASTLKEKIDVGLQKMLTQKKEEENLTNDNPNPPKEAKND